MNVEAANLFQDMFSFKTIVVAGKALTAFRVVKRLLLIHRIRHIVDCSSGSSSPPGRETFGSAEFSGAEI